MSLSLFLIMINCAGLSWTPQPQIEKETTLVPRSCIPHDRCHWHFSFLPLGQGDPNRIFLEVYLVKNILGCWALLWVLVRPLEIPRLLISFLDFHSAANGCIFDYSRDRSSFAAILGGHLCLNLVFTSNLSSDSFWNCLLAFPKVWKTA